MKQASERGWERRLVELGIELPNTPIPAGNYLLGVMSSSLLFVSGQTWTHGGAPQAVGSVPGEVSVDRAQLAARHCALACLAEVRAARGSIDVIRRVIRIGGYVRSAQDFGHHPAVVNGASDVFVQIFGESGRHARTSIGVASLPSGACVEIDALFEVDMA